jgi:peptidoglycan hydrolase-like protein with peptidoglycan-binding domain
MNTSINSSADLSIHDVQQRLELLSYSLGDESKQGLFGENTAAALAAFKRSVHLPSNDILDKETWAALLDASLTLGERALYLHMPHFEGRDVQQLQTALASLGFANNCDGVFGPNTERALRDFQTNMAIEANGICADETVRAVERLRHAWEGKRGVIIEGRDLGYTRASEVLETTSICVFGTNKTTRSIANRISNLAQATTAHAKVVSAAFLANGPSSDMLMVGLTSNDSNDSTDQNNAAAKQPGSAAVAVYASDETLPARVQSALDSCAPKNRRITIQIDTKPNADGETLNTRQEQHCAIVILDALCAAFA